MFTVNTLSNSSASLLSPRFVLIIVAPVCHHMANDSPGQKRQGESEEVSAREEKKVCLSTKGSRLRDQQKHHSCSRTRWGVFRSIAQRQFSDCNVKSWQATGTQPNGCLIAAHNDCHRLSGGPLVIFNKTGNVDRMLFICLSVWRIRISLWDQ